MNKILLALLVALLAGVALYFSLSDARRETALPELTAPATTLEPVGATPAPEVATPASPEVGDPEGSLPGAVADQRAIVDPQTGALLPPEERCTLAVQLGLPAGAPADDGAELLVVRGTVDLPEL